MLAFGFDRGARGAAVDAGGGDGEEHPAVEPGVASGDRGLELLLVAEYLKIRHASSVPHGPDSG
nr:hypothetical protein GCM10025732_38130 [Glycomyces mayteni]